MNNNRMSTQKLVKLALMTAISLVLVTLVRIPFPPLPFLQYDPADVPIYITAFAYGPVPGLIVTLVVCFIQAFLMGGDGFYGFIMHFMATGMVAVIIGAVYQKNKTRKRAAAALFAGVIVTIIVMCVMNYFVTSAYIGIPKEAVLDMMGFIVLFNLIKAGVNAVITFILYKRISGFLHNETSFR